MNEKKFFVKLDHFMHGVYERRPSSQPALLASFAYEAQAVALCGSLNGLVASVDESLAALRRARAANEIMLSLLNELDTVWYSDPGKANEQAWKKHMGELFKDVHELVRLAKDSRAKMSPPRRPV